MTPLLALLGFLAPDHGKSVWDGIAGLKKNRLANGELRRGKQQLPLINAERCAAYLNDTERKKAAGFDDRPFPVRAGSTYSTEISEHHRPRKWQRQRNTHIDTSMMLC